MIEAVSVNDEFRLVEAAGSDDEVVVTEVDSVAKVGGVEEAMVVASCTAARGGGWRDDIMALCSLGVRAGN